VSTEKHGGAPGKDLIVDNESVRTLTVALRKANVPVIYLELPRSPGRNETHLASPMESARAQ
jgi:hypothetical protein